MQRKDARKYETNRPETVAKNNKSSAVAEMGERSHKTWAEKRGAAVALLQGSWVPV